MFCIALFPYLERLTMLRVVPAMKFAPPPSPLGPNLDTACMALATSTLLPLRPMAWKYLSRSLEEHEYYVQSGACSIPFSGTSKVHRDS